MKEYPVPETDEARAALAKRLRRSLTAANFSAFLVAVVAILCLVGVLVCVIMLEVGERTVDEEWLLYLLTGIFAGATVVFALIAFFLGKLSQSLTASEADYRERCCGEACFFVGDGTIARFDDDCLRICAEGRPVDEKTIAIPYSEVRFFSVCSRMKPAEKGTWSVILQVPAHYVAKEGKTGKGAPAVLIQAEGKERLYRRLEALSLSLSGEPPLRGARPEAKKYTRRIRFVLPDRSRRKRAVLTIVFGALLVAGGIVAAILWDAAIGAVIAVFGALVTGRSVYAFVTARGLVGIYDEGIYWCESDRAASERFFLKWDEIVRIALETYDEKRFLALICEYGTYHIPDVAGAYEYCRKFRPALCEPSAEDGGEA